jgi:hypothetical protein
MDLNIATNQFNTKKHSENEKITIKFWEIKHDTCVYKNTRLSFLNKRNNTWKYAWLRKTLDRSVAIKGNTRDVIYHNNFNVSQFKLSHTLKLPI